VRIVHTIVAVRSGEKERSTRDPTSRLDGPLAPIRSVRGFAADVAVTSWRDCLALARSGDLLIPGTCLTARDANAAKDFASAALEPRVGPAGIAHLRRFAHRKAGLERRSR